MLIPACCPSLAQANLTSHMSEGGGAGGRTPPTKPVAGCPAEAAAGGFGWPLDFSFPFPPPPLLAPLPFPLKAASADLNSANCFVRSLWVPPVVYPGFPSASPAASASFAFNRFWFLLSFAV